jgi:hypothetical protein
MLSVIMAIYRCILPGVDAEKNFGGGFEKIRIITVILK